tara:strand:+ start:539 stop:727 length:189 start_codon:yes stop_codon:yes gene_type:complete
MEIGSIVRIRQDYPSGWEAAEGKIGIVTGLGKRLHIPAAKVMVLGEEAEFDLDELEVINADR